MRRQFVAFALALIVGFALLAPSRYAIAQTGSKAEKKTRALVLGGGGSVGVAWETGLVAGLAEKGVDLSKADFILGTSAGSVVGAQLALGSAPATMLSQILNLPQQPNAQPTSTAKPMAAPDLAPLIKRMQELVSGQRPPDQVRKEIGAWALSAPTRITEEQFVAYFQRTLPDKGWTKGNFACTSVDTSDGKPVVWNKDSGVGLARAVASSCAVPGIFPPISINGHRYMDGGMRSPTNADLAKGYGVVVVVALGGGPRTSQMAKRFGAIIDKELEVLRKSGSKVELITPDDASRAAFGPNLMDSSHRVAAAKAGLAQGKSAAAKLRSSWNQ
jgi:NTE family protein